MSDILSQEEVEKLYNKAIEGELNKTVKPEKTEPSVIHYNFQRPTRFNKDQIRTIQLLHDTFAGLYHNLLSSYLRCSISVNLIAVDQLIYSEYISSVGNPSLINIITMEPLKGQAILEINQSLAFAFFDRLLGGVGLKYNKSREFTEIEKVVIKKIVDEVLITLENAWKHVIDIKTQVKKTETNPQFVQVVSPETTVILITFEIKIDDTSGLISICLPYPVLEPIQMKLSSRNWFIFKDKTPSFQKDNKIEKKLHSSKLDVQAFLGTILIKAKDVLELKPGDIIKLDTKVNDLIRVDVEGLPEFYARPGLLNSRNSIQIQKQISKDERLDCYGQ
ncbi:MAG: flagellar motor switch protein FliM [Candidatus Firestonebacteria bacterium]|nr:flagellar motor switch protein FliM [Candidatus Firestonebacteria bacterium]